MNLVFYKPKSKCDNVTCTIRKTGLMAFSKRAIKKLNLEKNNFIKIGTNSDDKNDKALYIIVLIANEDNSFKVHAANDELYINLKSVLDQ